MYFRYLKKKHQERNYCCKAISIKICPFLQPAFTLSTSHPEPEFLSFFFFAERKHASKTWTICFLYPSLHKQTREGRDAARTSKSQESLKTPQWLCWMLCKFCSPWDTWSKINIGYLEDFLSASERWLDHFVALGHRVLFWELVSSLRELCHRLNEPAQNTKRQWRVVDFMS